MTRGKRLKPKMKSEAEVRSAIEGPDYDEVTASPNSTNLIGNGYLLSIEYS